jgi:hypothetical protein
LPTVLLSHQPYRFSLSCRHIHLLIGTRYLGKLATSHYETLVFLKLVEHDLQDQIVCNSCRKLHRIRDAREYTENGHQNFPVPVVPECLSDDRMARVTSYIHENFSTAAFKMTMKHYHHFGYGTQSHQLLNLLSSKSGCYICGTTRPKRKAEYQIKNGSLFIRNRIVFHGTCTGVEQDSIFSWICPHLEFTSRKQPAGLCIKTMWPLPLRRSGQRYDIARTGLI